MPEGSARPTRSRPKSSPACRQKQRKDAIETAALVRRGTPAAPIRTNTDGGMHAVFRNALKGPTVRDADGKIRPMTFVAAPGSIPATSIRRANRIPNSHPRGQPVRCPPRQARHSPSVPLPRAAPQPKAGAPLRAAFVREPRRIRVRRCLGATPSPRRRRSRRARPLRSPWYGVHRRPSGAAAGTRDVGSRGSRSESRSLSAREPAAPAPAARPTRDRQRCSSAARRRRDRQPQRPVRQQPRRRRRPPSRGAPAGAAGRNLRQPLGRVPLTAHTDVERCVPAFALSLPGGLHAYYA